MIIQIGNKGTQIFVNDIDFVIKVEVGIGESYDTISANLYVSRYNYLIISMDYALICKDSAGKRLEATYLDPSTLNLSVVNKELIDMFWTKEIENEIAKVLNERVDFYTSQGWTLK